MPHTMREREKKGGKFGEPVPHRRGSRRRGAARALGGAESALRPLSVVSIARLQFASEAL